MTYQKSTAKELDGRGSRRPIPPPPAAAAPLPLEKSRSPASQLEVIAVRRVGEVNNENSVPATTSRDKRTKQTARKHESNKHVPDSPKDQNSGPESKRQKTTKRSDNPHSPKMAKANPRRSYRKKAASPETLPAPHMIRSVNKYGFNVWIPAPEPTDVTTRRSGTKATAKLRSVPDASPFDDASINYTPDGPAATLHDEIMEGSVLGKNSRSDSDGKVGGEDVCMEFVESREKDDTDESLINARPEQSGENGFCKGVDMQEAGKQGDSSNVDREVHMGDLTITSEGVAVQVPGHRDTDHQIAWHDSLGSMQGEETMAVEATGPMTAKFCIKVPTPGSLYWRAADRVTATGVHFFNMLIEDLREMKRLQAFDQAQKQRVQSSSELRALFVSTVTDDQSVPEEYALVDARVKLQAGRIATYGVHLKERMATMRMFAARATQQPRDLVDGLAAAVEEARKELVAARKALDGDIQAVLIAEQSLKNLTGMSVPEFHDPTAEADALRRDNMINDINATIAEYESQVRTL